MGRRGPAPDPNRKAKSGGQASWTELPPTPSRALRNMPKAPTEDGWHPSTERWWKAIAKSSMAVLYDETDWAYLEAVLLPLMERFQREGHSKELASEIRLGGSRLGATVADRMGLRIKATGAATPTPTAKPKRGDSNRSDADLDDSILTVIEGGAASA
ncbi:MAG: hypothetical protein AAGA99_26600 [Actinomycetota bacterium]